MKKWKDQSRDGKVISSELKAGRFRLSIHRHISCEPDQWLGTISYLVDCRNLDSKDLTEAKSQLEGIFREILEKARKAINPTPRTSR